MMTITSPTGVITGTTDVCPSRPTDHRQRHVRILVDEAETEVVPYVMPQDSVTRVCFTSRTWDIMRQNFGIALDTDNVFICDHFLGQDSGGRLHNELSRLKASGLFERHIRKASEMKYSSLFLQEPNSSHAQLDGLVLMVKKLALYHDCKWASTSVQVSYFPEGRPEQTTGPQSSGPNPTRSRTLLKCLYFPNKECEEGVEYGEHFIKTKESEIIVQSAFDRLIVFWGDLLPHKATATNVEDFLISIWISR